MREERDEDSGGGGRTVLNRSQGGNLNHRCRTIDRRGKVQKPKGMAGKNRRWKHYGGGKDRVQAYYDVIAARTQVVCVGLGGVLSHLQVVSD